MHNEGICMEFITYEEYGDKKVAIAPSKRGAGVHLSFIFSSKEYAE